MKINKYVIIFFIIILIILSFLLFSYMFSYKNKNKENFSNKIYKIDEIRKNKEWNNLITNGNFENGQNPSNYITQSGYNKIILKKNPGTTPYVLEQKDTNNLTYYQMICDNEINSKYNFYFWLSLDQNIIIEEINFEKLIQIKIQNEDYTNYIPRLNYNIIQKIVLSNDENNTWYFIKYDFVSGSNTKDKMQIFLNYAEKLNYTYYFTSISLYKVLIDAENFIYNHKLINYVDGYHYESNIPTWHDLSGNGNDLFWSNIPISDLTTGSLIGYNSRLTGFSSSKISNTEFTIIICLSKNYENSASNDYIDNMKTDSEEENRIKEQILISIPGNDRYVFEILLKDNFLYLLYNGKTFKSKHELILYNKSLIAITFENSILNIYYDGVIIISEKMNKLYFNKNNFTINKNKNLDYKFYSILVYNRNIDKDELEQIRTYFIENKNKNFNTPNINNHHMFLAIDNNMNDTNVVFKGYNKKEDKNESVNNSFIDNFDNQNLMMKNDAMICPKVYKKDGNYIVYVPPNSYYSDLLNYSGEKSYGSNLEKARYTYNINFPKCSTPMELLPGKGKNYNETCPFIVHESNPCFTSSCADVNWNVKNYNDLKLNKNCKKAVSNYCHINYSLDDKCKCWNPKYKDNQECIAMRKYFEDPNDYCDPSSYNIEEHPEFHKYIKKDNIPCWGCNLTM